MTTVIIAPTGKKKLFKWKLEREGEIVATANKSYETAKEAESEFMRVHDDMYRGDYKFKFEV